jgi:hypothetical protein
MSSLIVIRIVPQTPVDANTFTDYLNPALGGLQITAFDLSFNNPTTGTASVIRRNTSRVRQVRPRRRPVLSLF